MIWVIFPFHNSRNDLKKIINFSTFIHKLAEKNIFPFLVHIKLNVKYLRPFSSCYTIAPDCGILKNVKEMQKWLLSSFTKEPLPYLNLLFNSYGENQLELGSKHFQLQQVYLSYLEQIL